MGQGSRNHVAVMVGGGLPGAIQSDAAYAVDSRIEGLGIWRRRN